MCVCCCKFFKRETTAGEKQLENGGPRVGNLRTNDRHGSNKLVRTTPAPVKCNQHQHGTNLTYCITIWLWCALLLVVTAYTWYSRLLRPSLCSLHYSETTEQLGRSSTVLRSQYSGETADEAKMQLFNVTFVRRGDEHETSPSGTDVHTWGPCSCSQNLPTLSSQKKTTHFCSLLLDNIRSSTATWQNQQRSSAEGIFQRLKTLWIQRLCYRLTHSGTAWPLEL